jgi:hypothetical protein
MRRLCSLQVCKKAQKLLAKVLAILVILVSGNGERKIALMVSYNTGRKKLTRAICRPS